MKIADLRDFSFFVEGGGPLDRKGGSARLQEGGKSVRLQGGEFAQGYPVPEAS